MLYAEVCKHWASTSRLLEQSFMNNSAIINQGMQLQYQVTLPKQLPSNGHTQTSQSVFFRRPFNLYVNLHWYILCSENQIPNTGQ